MRLLSLIIASLLLTSCSLFSPVPDVLNKYELHPTISHASTHHRGGASLLVNKPQAQPWYDTTNMAYSDHPYQVAYFAENAWAEEPANMLLPLMIQSLQQNKRYGVVIGPNTVARSEYELNTRLLTLLQDFNQKPAQLILSVRAELMRSSTRQVIATQTFTIREPLRAANPFGGVMAANRATTRFLQELNTFCLSH